MNHQLRLQSVISTLKQDLPTLFKQDISYSIYTQDIYFADPVNKFQGKFNYRIIFWTLRFHGGLFFTEIAFDLHDVYSNDLNTIIATWTVRGVLRVPWRAKLLFNGYSTYKLNADCLIYEHIDTWDKTPGEVLAQFWQKD